MDGSLAEDIIVIKSLIASSQGGLALHKLESEFREVTYSKLDFKKYGYKSLIDMLESSPEITLKQTGDGIMCHVFDKKLNHVVALVTNQKKQKKKTNRKPYKSYNKARNSYSNSSFYRGPSSSSYGQRSPLCKSRNPSHPPLQQQTRPSSSSYGQRSPLCKSRNPSRPPLQQQTRPSSSSYGQRSPLCKSRNPSRPPLQQQIRVSNYSSKAQSWQQPTNISFSQPYSQQQPRPQNEQSRQAPVQKVNGLSSFSSEEDWSSEESSQLACVEDLPARLSKINIRGSLSSDDWSSDAEAPSENVQTGFLSSCNELKPAAALQRLPSHSRTLDGAYPKNLCCDTTDSKNGYKTLKCNRSSLLADISHSLPSPPLMNGGIGRGKRFQSVVVKPGNTSSNLGSQITQKPKDLSPTPVNTEEITITKSPNKRVAVVTSLNGADTILVTVPNKMNVSSPVPSSDAEPFLREYQLIGDFCMLEIAEKCLGFKKKDQSLCRVNFTVSQCHKEVVQKNVSKNILMMIGFTDIMQGISLQQLKDDTTCLLKTLEKHHVILTTLPIPPCLTKRKHHKELEVLLAYNDWLCSQSSHVVVDISPHLYCSKPHYTRISDHPLIMETLSEEGCWILLGEVLPFI